MNTQSTWSIGKLTLGALFVVAAVALYNFSSNPVDAADNAVTATSTTSSNVIDKGLLAILDRIDSIRLDAAIFDDIAFTSLQDFTVTLIPQPTGRVNPFAPFNATSPTTAKPATKPLTGGR